MPRHGYDEAVTRLKGSRNGLRCSDLKVILESLGFEVERAASGNHQTFTHDHIEGFYGSNYDCGHGRNPQVKAAYVGNVLRVLLKYEDELRAFLEKMK